MEFIFLIFISVLLLIIFVFLHILLHETSIYEQYQERKDKLKEEYDDIVTVKNYRLSRAPERKVWNIDVGKMPKGKAEEYVRRLIMQWLFHKERFEHTSHCD